MDHLSLWINNKQLLSQVDVKSLQESIIQNVFGSFENMLNELMNKYDTLSLFKHIKLHQILLANHDGDIFNNYHENKNNDALCIANVPDDCLSYIIKFLHKNDRFIVQQTCRLFAVVARQEASFNIHSLTKQYSLFKITPNKQAIIDGLLSTQNMKNLESIDKLSAFLRHKFPNQLYCYHDIRKYSKLLPNTLTQIIARNIIKKHNNDITENKTDQYNLQQALKPTTETTHNLNENESCLDVLIFELLEFSNKTCLPVIANIFNASIHKTTKANAKYISKLMTALSSYSRTKVHIFDIMQYNKLMKSVLDILQFYTTNGTERMQPKRSLMNVLLKARLAMRQSMLNEENTAIQIITNELPDLYVHNGCDIISNILVAGYDSYRQILLNYGLFKTLKTILHGNAGDPEKLSKILGAFSATINVEEINMILEDETFFNFVMTKNINVITSIIANGNYVQRRQVIDAINNVNCNERAVSNDSLLTILESLQIHDTKLYKQCKDEWKSLLKMHGNLFGVDRIDSDSFSAYRRMLVMGVPKSAIMRKMKDDGINDDIIKQTLNPQTEQEQIEQEQAEQEHTVSDGLGF